MKKTILFFPILFLITFFSNTYFFSLYKNKNNISALEKKGKTYLVVIALDKYKNRLPLIGHVDDAKKIKNLLYYNYDIDNVIELYDYFATYNNIEKNFIQLKRELNINDSLIIYFSGHGYLDTNNNETYWLPYDAGINEFQKELWLSNNELLKHLSNINTNHILIISDSNFNESLIEPIITDKSINFNDVHFADAYSKKSRIFLGSGILETIFEKSEFSNQLYLALKRMTGNYTDVIMIYNEIKNKMKQSKPLFGKIQNSGHEKGASFILIPRVQSPIPIEEKLKKDKKEKIVIQKRTLSPANKAGIALLPIGASFTTAGIMILAFDFAFIIPEVNEMINNQTEHDYSDYEELYNQNLALFISGIAITTVGLASLSASIPLIVIKPKEKNLSLNISVNRNLELYFSYRF